MKVLHLLASGSFGGIETLIREYSFKSKQDNVFIFVWEKGPIYDEMVKQGIPCKYMGEKQGHFIHTVRHILKICKQEKPDVLVTHHEAPQFKVIISWLSVFCPSIRTLAYVHANAADIAKNGNGIKSFINKKIHEIGFKNANKIIAVSEFVKQSVINEFSISPEKIEVIYNGVDISKFQSENKSHNGSHIVFVGRLVEVKGVQIIIDALKMIQQEYYFDIVGDGEYRGYLEKQMIESGLQDRITFLGARGDVGHFLENAGIFIHVPLCEEGFGITVVEAMASGLTCICSKSGGIPELIEDGVTGYLIEKDSATQLRKILEKVIINYNSDEQERIRERARKKAEKFSIQNYVYAIDTVVESLYCQ